MQVKKVVIINSSSPYAWYNNSIGQTYDVIECEEEPYVLFDDESCFIDPKDCLEIPKLRQRKLKRILC